jgi:hypothetical protein
MLSASSSSCATAASATLWCCQDKTLVAVSDDNAPLGIVALYVGEKRATGSEIERAGLVDGSLYAFAVDGITDEVAFDGSLNGTSTPLLFICICSSSQHSAVLSTVVERRRPSDQWPICSRTCRR